MQKSLLVLGFLLTTSFLFAQTPARPYQKKHGFMLGVTFNDFTTPRLIKSSSVSSVLRNKQFSGISEMEVGFGVAYIRTLSSHTDFYTSLNASSLRYPFKSRALPADDKLLLELDANVDVRLLRDGYVLNPYLTAGAGVSYYDVHYGAYVPLGMGLQFKLVGNGFARLQAQYRVGITQLTTDHFNFSLKVGSMWGSRTPEVKPAPAAPVVTDRDGDGITDERDQCPDEAGVAQYNGCPVPDADNDGITDDKDKCPTVAGLAKYDGCPIPDTDGDRLNDEEDKCPTVAGVARLQGCPETDSDGDGVPDDIDRCPNQPGPASNNGCPERKAPTEQEVKKVAEAARFVYFETGSAKLKSASTPALQQVITIMKANPDAVITVEGHTDNVGSAQLNKKLSEDRAASVKSYLVDKGIDESRITTAGYGFDKPVASNATAAGRSKNRRVVMTLE